MFELRIAVNCLPLDHDKRHSFACSQVVAHLGFDQWWWTRIVAIWSMFLASCNFSCIYLNVEIWTVNSIISDTGVDDNLLFQWGFEFLLKYSGIKARRMPAETNKYQSANESMKFVFIQKNYSQRWNERFTGDIPSFFFYAFLNFFLSFRWSQAWIFIT